MILMKNSENGFIASCPVCANSLFRATPMSVVYGHCPKCGNQYKIEFDECGFHAISQNPAQKKNTAKKTEFADEKC